MTLNKILRWTVIASVFSLCIVPFIVSPSLFFPFIVGKNLFFRVIVEIGLAAWLWLAFRDASARPRVSALLWSFLAFAGVMGLATVFGENAWKSFWSNFERMEGYVTVLHLLAYFVIASTVLNTEKLWTRFFQTSLGASTCVSAYALFQYFGIIGVNQGGDRLDATLGNATYLAVYVLFNLFLAVLLAFRFYRQKLSNFSTGVIVSIVTLFIFISLFIVYRETATYTGFWSIAIISLIGIGATFLARIRSAAYLYGFVAILSGFVLYNTGTRGAVLGLLAGALVTASLVALFDRSEKRSRIIAGSLVGAGLLLVGGFIAVKNTSFVQNSPVLSRYAGISLSEVKNQGRFFIWPMAVEGFKERPVLGWGQDNFNYVFNANYDPRMYGHEQWFDRAHNVFLDWLIAGGILGLLAYLSLYVSGVFLLWKKSTDVSFMEKALLTGLGTAYFVHSLFVFDNVISYILFVSMLAFIHFRSTRLVHPVASKAKDVDDSSSHIVGATILIALCFTMYSVNVRTHAAGVSLLDGLRYVTVEPMQPEAALASFEKSLSYDGVGRTEALERVIEAAQKVNTSGASLETRQKFYDLGHKTLAIQLERTPGDARYELFAGIFYSAFGQNDEAEKHFLEAQRLSPRKQTILFALGGLYLNTKEYDKALAVFKGAFELETSHRDAANYYAIALIYAGREAEAKAFLKENFGSDDMTSDIFLKTYINASDWTNVVKIFKARIAADPSNMSERQNLAAAYVQAGDKANAILTIREMIRLVPSFKSTGDQYIQQIEALGR